MSKKRRLMMESVPHDVVERILERSAVKSLVRFKAVSKQWKSTIESPYFQEKQLKQREQSGDPDVLMVSVLTYPPDIESLRTLELGLSSSVKIPTPWEKENTQYFVSYHSCDGLVCLYHPRKSGFVVNPATRWYRPLPLCRFQQRMIDLGDGFFKLVHAIFKVGFGKDILTGTYKAVWLYNTYSPEEIGPENDTTCEVFDFTTNAWSFITPAPPYRILGVVDPVFVDGSLHWFTECLETKVVSFDLHTQAFQVLSKAPFAYLHCNHRDLVMCNLDNRLCVSEKTLPNQQVIWSFDSANKTWDQIFTIDLYQTQALYGSPTLCAFHPLALLDGKNNKKKKKKNLLFYDPIQSQTLLTHDPESKSDHVAFRAYSIGFAVCYFQSLISI